MLIGMKTINDETVCKVQVHVQVHVQVQTWCMY
jgi:hypothetical protein